MCWWHIHVWANEMFAAKGGTGTSEKSCTFRVNNKQNVHFSQQIEPIPGERYRSVRFTWIYAWCGVSLIQYSVEFHTDDLRKNSETKSNHTHTTQIVDYNLFRQFNCSLPPGIGTVHGIEPTYARRIGFPIEYYF